jgi:hypothetical protein
MLHHGHSAHSSLSPRRAILLVAVGLVGVSLLATLSLGLGSSAGFESSGGISTISRLLSAYLTVLMTSLALIIPLTSNLYTPSLVKLYVRHPMIVAGLGIVLTGHGLLASLHFFPAGGAYARVVTKVMVWLIYFLLLSAPPFLYGLSRFLRPAFFMPMLTHMGVKNLSNLMERKNFERSNAELFETIDVVTNVALTGMGRGDRQLVLLALRSLHTLLVGIIGCGGPDRATWRKARPSFVPGMAEEGEAYLIRERVWPEAYVLAQTLKVMEVADHRQHELLAELASQLVDSARLAAAMEMEQVMDLHIMTFNTLFREAVEAGDLRRFQNLSYYYRLLIEVFRTSPQRMHEATRHFIHYGKMASQQKLHFAFETVVYDLGELVLSLGRLDEERSVELIQAWAGPVWQDCLAMESLLKKVGWRTVLRTHWEARSLGLKEVTDAIYWRFLTDEAIHREQLEMLLEDNRELHYEFNDRLMRFAHLSPRAVAEAQAFLEQW